MIGFALIGGVLLVWVIVLALMWRGKGDVGMTLALEQRIKLRIALANFERVVGESFVPALRRMTDQIVKVNAAMERMRDVG